MVFTLSYEFLTYVHHTLSPLGHCKKLDQIKRGIIIECTKICPKENRNPTLCQGPHNPIAECQPLECDYNECRPTPTLWPSGDWKHFPICIGAPVFCQTVGCHARSHVSKSHLEIGHNKQLLGVAKWATTRVKLGMWVLCYEAHNQLLPMEVCKLV